MNTLWEQLNNCKEKIKELETQLDSANKELEYLKDKIAYICICAAQKE